MASSPSVIRNIMLTGSLGSAPPEKHVAILSRRQQQVSTARLFYTTSPSSRSGPSSSRTSCILPPFASHTFIHALESLHVKTQFVPLGEADGVCVTLADRLGGYVIGQDSDFFILAGGAGLSSKLRGYCPIEMMWWIDGELGLQPEPSSASSGWSTAFSRRGPSQSRQSTFLPPAHFVKPQLVLTAFAPQGLRARLRLPASVLPLFASLCGNDYTPRSAAEYLFESGFTPVQKIEKVARILREQIFSPRSTPTKSGSAGDHAVELVKKVIRKLSSRPFVNDQALQDLVDAVIEATFQYILPPSGECCSTYPFCGELDELGCQSNSSQMKHGTAREAYAAAQRRGLVNGIIHAWLYPYRVYLWSVLEDPSGPSLKASRGLQEVRRKAWEIAEEGLGGLRWPASPEEEPEAAGKVADPSTRLDADTSEGTLVPTGASSEADTVVDGDSSDPEESRKPGTLKLSRSITEYVRQGSSVGIVPHQIELAVREPQEIPTCLQPLEVRLRAYLVPLQSDIPSIVSLPPHLHPAIATIRFCILTARTGRWRRSEVEAVLKSCIGCFAAWQKDFYTSKTRRDGDDGAFPILTNRNCGLVAQLGATMTDAHLLAQALLLLPDTPDERGEGPGLTHLIPFVFISGVVLHTLLSGDEPVSSSVWRWTETEQETYETCFAAMTDGIEDVIVGWTRTPPWSAPTNTASESTDGDREGAIEEKVRRNKKKNQRGRRGDKGFDTGRFEALNGLTA